MSASIFVRHFDPHGNALSAAVQVASNVQSCAIAVSPGGEPQAGHMLLTATNTASQGFTSTIATIDSTLGRSPS